MKRKAFLILAAGLLLPSFGAEAQTAAGLAAGKSIAQRFCARCHAIGTEGTSPHPSAPPFRIIVAQGQISTLRAVLGEGIAAGHPHMPQFQFKPADLRLLIDYLKSLSGKA